MRTSGNRCEKWWESLDEGEKNTVWILMKMVRQMKVGGKVELKRGPKKLHAEAVDLNKAQQAGLN